MKRKMPTWAIVCLALAFSMAVSAVCCWFIFRDRTDTENIPPGAVEEPQKPPQSSSEDVPPGTLQDGQEAPENAEEGLEDATETQPNIDAPNASQQEERASTEKTDTPEVPAEPKQEAQPEKETTPPQKETAAEQPAESDTAQRHNPQDDRVQMPEVDIADDADADQESENTSTQAPAVSSNGIVTDSGSDKESAARYKIQDIEVYRNNFPVIVYARFCQRNWRTGEWEVLKEIGDPYYGLDAEDIPDQDSDPLADVVFADIEETGILPSVKDQRKGFCWYGSGFFAAREEWKFFNGGRFRTAEDMAKPPISI